VGAKRLRAAAALAAIVVPLAVSAGLAPEHSPLHLRVAGLAVTPSAVDVGTTVLLAAQTKTARCTLGPNPDRACSPGAYYSRLTKRRICSEIFLTSDIRHVTDGTKHAVEIAYGLAPKGYGSTLEIDHIVSLELGGSNEIANLFPERANAHPGYHAKDKLENRLHDLVCEGTMHLRDVQRQIASNWQTLYKRVFGTAPG